MLRMSKQMLWKRVAGVVVGVGCLTSTMSGCTSFAPSFQAKATPNFERRLLIADQYVRQGHYHQAEALYQEVLTADPHSQRAKNGLVAIAALSSETGRVDASKLAVAKPSTPGIPNATVAKTPRTTFAQNTPVVPLETQNANTVVQTPPAVPEMDLEVPTAELPVLGTSIHDRPLEVAQSTPKPIDLTVPSSRKSTPAPAPTEVGAFEFEEDLRTTPSAEPRMLVADTQLHLDSEPAFENEPFAEIVDAPAPPADLPLANANKKQPQETASSAFAPPVDATPVVANPTPISLADNAAGKRRAIGNEIDLDGVTYFDSGETSFDSESDIDLAYTIATEMGLVEVPATLAIAENSSDIQAIEETVQSVLPDASQWRASTNAPVHSRRDHVARLEQARQQLTANANDASAWRTIDELLSLEEDAVNSLTVLTLGELPEACHEAAVQRLWTVLTVESDDDMKASAALALGGLGDAAAPAVPTLKEILLTGGEQSRDAAHVSLACLGIETDASTKAAGWQ